MPTVGAQDEHHASESQTALTGHYTLCRERFQEVPQQLPCEHWTDPTLVINPQAQVQLFQNSLHNLPPTIFL